MPPTFPISSKHPKTLSEKQGIRFQSQSGETQPSSDLQKTYNITFDGVFYNMALPEKVVNFLFKQFNPLVRYGDYLSSAHNFGKNKSVEHKCPVSRTRAAHPWSALDFTELRPPS